MADHHPSKVTHQPSAFYYRQAIFEASNRARAVALGLQVVREYERLEAWCIEHGMTPPAPRFLLTNEVENQGVSPKRRGSGL